MTDQMPKPTGLSKPSVGDNDPFIKYAKYMSPQIQSLSPAAESNNQQGAFGDAVDSFQRGIGQTVGGDLETAGQLAEAGWDGGQDANKLGRAVSAWGDSQTQQMSQEGQDSLNKEWYHEDAEGNITAGDAMTDWRSWVNQGSTLAGQVASMVVGTKGAGLVARPLAKGAVKLAAKEAVEGYAQRELAKSAVKESIKKGALTDVRAALAAAPDADAVNAVIKNGMSRLSAIGYGAHSTAMASGLRAQQARDEARDYWSNLPEDQLLGDERYQKAYWDLAEGDMQGADPTDIYHAAINGMAEEAATNAWHDPRAMASDAVAGSLEGAFAGIGGLAGKIGSKTRLGAATKSFATEYIGEGWQAGETQRAVNEAIKEWADESRDPMAGVFVQALTEATIAGPVGGVAGAVQGPHAAANADAKVSSVPLDNTSFTDVDAWANKMAGVLGPNTKLVNGDDAKKMIARSMAKRGASAEFSDLVAERASNIISGKVPVNAMAATPSAPPSSQDQRPFYRPDGELGWFNGFADDSAAQQSLAQGQSSPTADEMIRQQIAAGNQGKTMQERVLSGELGYDPFVGNKPLLQVSAENAPLALPNKDIIFAGDANAKLPGTEVAEPGAFDDKQAGTGPQFRGAERTRWQDGQEGDVLPPESAGNPAGALPGRVIDGEAREIGTELPYKPFIAGQDNRAAVSEEQRRRAEQLAMAEQQQNQPKQIGQSDTIFAPGAPGADNKNSAYTPPRLSRDQVDNTLGEQSTRDPRSPVAQAIEQAGSEQDSIFGQLKTLRITKRGKPWGSQKEAQLASRPTETPIGLPTGGFGVVAKAELEQVQASQAPVKQPSSNAGQLGQSGEVLRSPNSASTKATAGEASQVNHDSNEAPGSDVGNGFKTGAYKGSKYRVSTTNTTGAENGTPIYEKRMPSGSAATFYVGKDGNLLDGDSVAFNDERSKERVWRPASKEQTAEAASILDEMGKLDLNDPKRAELKVKLKALVLGETTSTIKPSMQAEASQNQSIRQADQTVKSIDHAKQNTAPASDAGVAVSGAGKQRITIEPLTDKSIIVKGDKNDAELKDRVEAAWPKAKPLYNERHKGWVFSSKREGVVREALADLLAPVEAKDNVVGIRPGVAVVEVSDGEYLVKDPKGTNLATFKIGQRGGAVGIKHFYPGQAAEKQANAAIAKFLDERDTQEAVAAAAKARRDETRQDGLLPTDGVMTLDQLKQLRIDTINKLAQQEADNHSTDDRLQRKKDQLDRAIAEAEAQTKAGGVETVDRPGSGGNQAGGLTGKPESKLDKAAQAIQDKKREKAEKLKRLLQERKGTLNAGIDPEVMIAVAELGALSVADGAVRFAQFVRDTLESTRDVGIDDADVKPFLKEAYGAIASNPEKYGVSDEVADQMDLPRDVRRANLDEIVSNEQREDSQPKAKPEDEAKKLRTKLRERLYLDLRSGIEIANNNDLKKAAANALGIKPADVTPLQLKEAQEAYEAAAANVRREQIQKRLNAHNGQRAAFDYAVDEYGKQPNLDVRTANSSDLQAYSTPTPMALLAGLAAGVHSATSVYEPTAGNGLLLLTADPANTYANELDPARADNLAWSGFDVTVLDATNTPFEGAIEKPVDAVLANPPFGKLRDADGKPAKYTFTDEQGRAHSFGEIDHVIAKHALDAMKDDGKAALILGAAKEPGDYTGNNKAFLNWLYSNYNVVHHIEVDGDLYKGQGAGWPTQMIVIHGRAKQGTGKFAPFKGEIKRLDNWSDIYDSFKTLTVGAEGAIYRTREGNGRVLPAYQRTSERNGRIETGEGRSGGVDTGLAGSRANGSGRPARSPVGKSLNDGGNTDGTFGNQRDIKSSGLGSTDGRSTTKPERTGRNENDDHLGLPGQRDGHAVGHQHKPKDISTKVEKVNDFQAAYQTASNGFNDAVLTPINMASYTQKALADIQDRHGSVDGFVADRLGYDSHQALHKAFMGLQVDAVALAVDAIERGRAIIIGDQTGVGKGRQAAGVIRYAMQQGLTPIFVTQKPNLFTDMYDDLADIGVTEFKPLIMNQDKGFISKNDEKLFDLNPGLRSRLLRETANNAALPANYHGLFLTYSQISSDQTGKKLDVLRRLAPKSLFILDESHTAAGGDSKLGIAFQTLVDEAKGVTYLSATYAKRPDNMTLYTRTDLGLAVENKATLIGTVMSGGIGMQTYIASKLSEAGQMVRRERSFDGIRITNKVLPDKTGEVTRQFDDVTEALRAIQDLSSAWKFYVDTQLAKQIQAESGMDTRVAGNKADTTVNVTLFSSVVHNYIAQLSLGLKARQTAQLAIEAIKNGQRPVIAVENTMGAALKDFRDRTGLSLGDHAEGFNYAQLLKSIADGVLSYSVKQPGATKAKTIHVPIHGVDSDTIQSLYASIMDLADNMDVAVPASPIDAIRAEITKAGYSVAEITGREEILDYRDNAKIIKRPKAEQDRRAVVDRFNRGKLDVLILNQAGSTGLSIHASDRFADQRPRHMIVAQPSLDINTFMQMLGRVNRTGQVVKPTYDLVWLDLPSEVRPAAVLSRKMASLNANTSGNTDSATNIDSVDLLNPYGDKVVAEYVEANSDILYQYSPRLVNVPDDDAASYFLGKLAVTPVAVQKQVLEEIEANYRTLIEYLDATGQNELNMSELDLDAKPLEQMKVSDGRANAGVFAEPTYITKVDVKAQGKAPSWDEVKSELAKSSQADFDDAIDRMQADEKYQERLQARYDKQAEEVKKQDDPQKKHAEQLELTKRKDQMIGFTSAKNELERKFKAGGTFAHGAAVRVKLPENESPVTGIVVSLNYSHESGNPAALSKWKVGIMLADRIRLLPLSMTREEELIEGPRRDSEANLKAIFDRAAEQPSRESRFVMTGNLIEAQSRSSDKGRIVPFTTHDGRVIQGMLMPKKFKPADLQDKAAVSANQAFDWLSSTEDRTCASMGLRTADGEVLLRRNYDGGYTLELPKAVSKGKRYWGDPRMVAIIGEQAVKGAGKLAIKLDHTNARSVAGVMANINPLGIYNQAQIKDYNRKTGKAVPTFDSADIRFSLSDAAPNTRGMTKPELEMVVTDWSKQYKGAAGARVLVAKDDADMASILDMVGAKIPQGQRVNAAYIPGKKTLVLNASAIPTARRARELLRHELLAHYGLREVVGDDAYISIIEAVKRGKDIKGIKDAYYQVAENYTDMHPDVQAEEVFAHWMEKQPDRGELAIWWRGIVRRVKDALRAVGLVGERTTEEEFNRVLDAIATGMRNGRQPGRRVMEAGRRDFDTKALAKLASTVTTDEQPAGINVEQAQAIADAFMKAYNGNIPLKVQVANTQEELYGPDATIDNIGRVKGAYHPAKGVFTLAARNLSSVGDAIETIRHEVLGHYGLNTFTPVDKRQILDQLIGARDTKGPLGDIWAEIDRLYAGKSVDVRAEEVFSRVVEQEPAKVGKIKSFVDRLLQNLNVALRKAGLVKGPMKLNELRRLARYVAEGIRSGRRQQQTFPTTDDALFRLGGETADDHLGSAERKLNLVPPPDIIDRTKSRINTLRRADKQQVKTWWSELVHKANTQVLDRLAPLKYAEELAGKSDAGDSGYVAARLATGSASTMQATLLYGLPEWKDGVIQKKAGTGESDALLGIFEGLGKDLHNWLGWMAGHRAEQLMAEGRENLLTKEEIDALKQLNHGKEAAFNEAKKKWIALNKAVLDLGQEAGLFTAEDRSGWENEWYIPFFRESEDGDVAAPFKSKGIANQTAGIKKLKGGTANVNDLLENIFTTTGKMIDAAMKNMAAQKVVWNLADTDLIDVIAKPNLMDMRAASNPSNQMMWVKIDGENYLLKVNEPDLFRAMTMIDQKNDRGPAMQLAMKAKNLLTAGVTASPEFMLRNFLRDAVSAWAINDDGFRPLIDSVRGVRKTLKMNGDSIDMMFSGASFLGGYVNGNNPEAMASSVRKALRAKGMTPEQIERYEKSLIRNGKQALDVLGHYWRKYERFGEAIENGSREAVYEAAIKAGKSHAQAAFEAKDLMDFSMVGSSKLMHFLVDVLPFFNARMQGLGKLGRAIRNNPRQIAMRGGMIAAASLALLAMNWDDDRYDDLPDWDKDLNWHFWFGDDHYRIPKPFEIGLIFGTLPERMTRAMGGKDTAGKFGEVVARNMLETFSINPIPQVVKPLSEAYFNYDPFRGGPIDDMSDLNVLPEARYDERTSLLMRELGELTGFSPKKLQHIVEGYTGTIGAYVLAAGDGVTRMLGDYGVTPSMRADEIPLLRTVYQGSAPARSSQAMTDFYKMMEEVNELHSTINQYRKEGRYEEATALATDNRAALAKRRSLTSAQKQFRALRNDMELIRRSKELTADEKRTRINNMLARRNNLAARMIRRFEAQ